MLSAYPACFIKEENGYSVIFPDLNAATCGPTLDNATQMAVDCLAGYLYTLQRDGQPAPAPSPLNQVDPSAVLVDLWDGSGEVPDYETFTALITVDVEEYAKHHFEKSVKKTLSIPAWLNEAALREHLNFSQILQEALKERLGTQ